MSLLLIDLHLIAVKVPQLVLHTIEQLVLLDLEAALVDPSLAELGQLDFWRGPVRQKVVGLVEQVIEAVKVPLNRNLHLIALNDLLSGTFKLIIGFFKNLSVVVHQFLLLSDGAISLCAVDWYAGSLWRERGRLLLLTTVLWLAVLAWLVLMTRW